jgi:sec-independent protein translocase protein TatA
LNRRKWRADEEDFNSIGRKKAEARRCSGAEEFMFEGLMQPMHLLVILFIALLFFGPSKLGDLGKGLGDGIRHFKNAMREGSERAAPAEKPQEQK